MPSKRCATSAKRSGNCSSAPVTNRMACQSRCEIQVQASHRRILTACSRLSTARNRAVWGLGCRSAGRLSKRITDDCGPAQTCPAAPRLNSPCLPIQTVHSTASSGRSHDLGFRASDDGYRSPDLSSYRLWHMALPTDQSWKALRTAANRPAAEQLGTAGYCFILCGRSRDHARPSYGHCEGRSNEGHGGSSSQPQLAAHSVRGDFHIYRLHRTSRRTPKTGGESTSPGRRQHHWNHYLGSRRSNHRG